MIFDTYIWRMHFPTVHRVLRGNSGPNGSLRNGLFIKLLVSPQSFTGIPAQSSSIDPSFKEEGKKKKQGISTILQEISNSILKYKSKKIHKILQNQQYKRIIKTCKNQTNL